MQARAIADTNALTYFLRRKGPHRTVARLWTERRLATTTLTAFELWAWRGGPEAEAKVGAFLEDLVVFELDLEAARFAASVARALAGQPIGDRDTLIAGVCLARGLPLITANRREFARVPGLDLLEP